MIQITVWWLFIFTPGGSFVLAPQQYTLQANCEEVGRQVTQGTWLRFSCRQVKQELFP